MGKYTVNKKARNYRDCMTPDQATQRCRPGARSPNPQIEARKRNDELLEASGELITLFTKSIKGDDVIDRVIGPVQNNYVAALPLNLIFAFDSNRMPGNVPGKDDRFSANLSSFFSDPSNATRHWQHNQDGPPKPYGNFKPIVIARTPQTGKTHFLYVGNRLQFSNLSVKLFTRLKSDNVVWEYSRGNNVWMPIPVNPTESTPGASSLMESGRMVFDPSMFATWKQDYINNELAFWIRARIDENTEGEAAALLIITEHIIQSAIVWNDGDDAGLFPNDKCVTIKVNGRIYNRVYDLHQLDYSEESFVLIRRTQLNEICPLDIPDNEECEMFPFDTCETDPLSKLHEIGTLDYSQTRFLRQTAFLTKQLMRTRQSGSKDAVIVLFTRDLRLDSTTITATYTNMCPCTAYGKMQAPIDDQLVDIKSLCAVCLGTTFVNGFQRFINPEREDGKILMSFPAAPLDIPLEEVGLGLTHELTTARLSWTPRIFVRDFIIRYDEQNRETIRYMVITRTDSIGRRGVLLHQEVVLQAINPDRFQYRILAPDLPLAPSQSQVLKSLGVIVPDIPGLDECEQKRLLKGSIHCSPVRDRRRE